MGLLDGRNAVITGGAQGIGYEIAGVLGGAGARVVLGDINEDTAAEAAERLAKNGVAATSLGPRDPRRASWNSWSPSNLSNHAHSRDLINK
ncbi:SDR family NAD(P)-dependent oxidoreductase [Streptomyces mirabilis]